MKREYLLGSNYRIGDIYVQWWSYLEEGDNDLGPFAHNPREKRKDSDTGFAHPELGFIRAVRNGKTLWEFQTPRGAGICNFAAGFFEEWNQYIISVTDWEGWRYILDPETGSVTSEDFHLR